MLLLYWLLPVYGLVSSPLSYVIYGTRTSYKFGCRIGELDTGVLVYFTTGRIFEAFVIYKYQMPEYIVLVLGVQRTVLFEIPAT